MKTNQIMVSENRELFGITIRQETKTNMLNLSDLKEAYTHGRVLRGWSDRNITEILSSKYNSERIYHLLNEQTDVKLDFSTFTKSMSKNPARTLKSLGMYKTTGKADNRSTWCNPYLWVLVAMEMNPELYAKVTLQE